MRSAVRGPSGRILWVGKALEREILFGIEAVEDLSTGAAFLIEGPTPLGREAALAERVSTPWAGVGPTRDPVGRVAA